MDRLTGKTAIITGAAGGIGSASVRRFIEEGANVLAVDRDEDALTKLAETLPSENFDFVAADVTDEAATEAFVKRALSRFGQIDIALLNAGIEGEIGRIDNLPVSMFDTVMAVNVRSVWLGLAQLLPVMRKAGGGSIVIMSSVAGLRGSARLPAYSASKHAVVGLMKSAALDGAADKVRVNAVNPAPVRTRMMESIDAQSEAAGRTGDPAEGLPMKRYADPSEVASLMLFLASGESSYCSGSCYAVDGALIT